MRRPLAGSARKAHQRGADRGIDHGHLAVQVAADVSTSHRVRLRPESAGRRGPARRSLHDHSARVAREGSPAPFALVIRRHARRALPVLATMPIDRDVLRRCSKAGSSPTAGCSAAAHNSFAGRALTSALAAGRRHAVAASRFVPARSPLNARRSDALPCVPAPLPQLSESGLLGHLD